MQRPRQNGAGAGELDMASPMSDESRPRMRYDRPHAVAAHSPAALPRSRRRRSPLPVRSRNSAACRPRADRRAARRRLRAVPAPHVDRFRAERRADDRLRELRHAAQPDRRRPRRGARDRCRVARIAIPVGDVLASPYCRTLETGRLVFGARDASRAVRGGPARPDSAERYAELRALLGNAGAARHQRRDREPRQSVRGGRRAAVPRRGRNGGDRAAGRRGSSASLRASRRTGGRRCSSGSGSDPWEWTDRQAESGHLLVRRGWALSTQSGYPTAKIRDRQAVLDGCSRDLAISAASRCMNSSGLMTRCVMPSTTVS